MGKCKKYVLVECYKVSLIYKMFFHKCLNDIGKYKQLKDYLNQMS